MKKINYLSSLLLVSIYLLSSCGSSSGASVKVIIDSPRNGSVINPNDVVITETYQSFEEKHFYNYQVLPSTGEVNILVIPILLPAYENIDINNINVIINSVKVFKTYLIFEVEKTNELLRVQKELADNLLKNGFNVDTKEYYPHITIIRKPENVNSIALNNINKNLNIISKVTEITLFESTRINGRLQYIKL